MSEPTNDTPLTDQQSMRLPIKTADGNLEWLEVVLAEFARGLEKKPESAGPVTRQQIEYWIQEKRPNGWIDYGQTDNLKICDMRIGELKNEKRGRTFRPIVRIITDKSPNHQSTTPAADPKP